VLILQSHRRAVSQGTKGLTLSAIEDLTEGAIMKKKGPAKKPKEARPDLRRRAEERMRKGATDISGMPAKDVEALVQELQVHQVELAEARDLYLALFESAPVGYLTLDGNRVIRQANLKAASLLGTDRSRLIGARMSRFASKEYRDDVYLALKEALDSGHGQALEAEFQRADGSRFFGRMEASPPGRGASLLRVVLSDVTEKKQAERTRNETVALLDSLYRTAPVGLCLLDRGLRYLRVNDRLAEINGKPAGEHIGRTVREIVPQFAELAEELAGEIFRTGKPILDRKFEGETAAAPGVRRIWLESWWPLKEEGREEITVISVVVRDVTELERAKEDLKTLNDELAQRVVERTQEFEERREWHRQRVESIPHKVWSILPDGTGEYCNQRTLDYLGMTREEMKGWHWGDVIHPEDRERLAADLSEMLRSGRESQTEMRILRGADGAYRWHAAHAAPMLDHQGRIVRWLGTCTDIQDRRELEGGLRQMSRIFEDAAVPILVQDAEGKVVDLNEEAQRVLGWTKGEILGKSLKTVLAPEWYESFDRMLTRSRTGESLRNEEIVLLKQSGERMPALLTVSVLAGEAGEEGFSAAVIAKDISRIKLTEEALRSSETSLREEKNKLEEKNIALREILEQVEEEKSKIWEGVADHLREWVLPVLDRVSDQGDNPSVVAVLKHSLEDLVSPSGRRLSEDTARLTAREKEVCRMLKGGLTSKEVSKILECSHQTVEKHRKNIRKKLGIVGKGKRLGVVLSGL
jgi:PAS domain S-box-containing protein